MKDLKELKIEEIQELINKNDIDILMTSNIEALTKLQLKTFGYNIYINKAIFVDNLKIIGSMLIVVDNEEISTKKNVLLNEDNVLSVEKFDTHYLIYNNNNFPIYIVKIKQ